MVFNIVPVKDEFLDDNYKIMLKELSEFYGLNWVNNVPNLFIAKDRSMINELKGRITGAWVVAWSKGGDIFLLDRNNFEAESSHEYSDEYYLSIIKHELSHCFFNIITKSDEPVWLDEGLAIYSSGQCRFKKEPKEFKNFLKFYDKTGKGVYSEVGFVVKLLIDEYGRSKLLKLLDELKSVDNEDKFKELFLHVYEFKLNYKNLNKLKKA